MLNESFPIDVIKVIGYLNRVFICDRTLKLRNLEESEMPKESKDQEVQVGV